jgi:hypothetical protein
VLAKVAEDEVLGHAIVEVSHVGLLVTEGLEPPGS